MALRVPGDSAWRLPTKDELDSIVAHGVSDRELARAKSLVEAGFWKKLAKLARSLRLRRAADAVMGNAAQPGEPPRQGRPPG